MVRVGVDDDTDLEPIGALIRRHRTEFRLSQRGLARALADASGNDAIEREQVARWEGGRRIPSAYWRHWLARVLVTTEEELERAAAVARFTRSLATIIGPPRQA